MSQITYEDYTLLPHPTEPQVFLLPSDTGWTLPCLTPLKPHYWQDVAPVNQAMLEQLNIKVTTLRCLSSRYDQERLKVMLVYALENHDPTWIPPTEGRWAERHALNGLNLAVLEHRPLLATWLAEVEKGDLPTPQRVPWFLPGWSDKAVAWIKLQLDRLGLTQTAPVEQLRSWQRSAIWRVSTTDGDCYFKAVPPMFAHEPVLTQQLAEQYPTHLPEILAVELEQHWFLMRDTGDQTLDKVPDIARWEEALQIYAQLQIDLVGQTEKLLEIGCPNQQLDKLREQIEPLLADLPSAGKAQGLSRAEIEELHQFAPQLSRMCVELAGYGVPQTLEHGDFHLRQIIVTEKSCLYFDWSDASVAHPFFSLALFFRYLEGEEGVLALPEVKARLRDAYLEPWTIYEPRPRLVEAFELAQSLAGLYYALKYHRIILPNMEAKWEAENTLPFWLRILLQRRV